MAKKKNKNQQSTSKNDEVFKTPPEDIKKSLSSKYSNINSLNASYHQTPYYISNHIPRNNYTISTAKPEIYNFKSFVNAFKDLLENRKKTIATEIKSSKSHSSGPNNIKPLLNSFDKDTFIYKKSSQSSPKSISLSSNNKPLLKESSKSPSSGPNNIEPLLNSFDKDTFIYKKSSQSSPKSLSSGPNNIKPLLNSFDKDTFIYKKSSQSSPKSLSLSSNNNSSIDENTKEICKKWGKIKLTYPNELFNPNTNRNIKKYGPTYNELEKLCVKLKLTKNDLEDVIIEKKQKQKQILTKPLNKKLCKIWNGNKEINPITNRKIKEEGYIYKAINKKCI